MNACEFLQYKCKLRATVPELLALGSRTSARAHYSFLAARYLGFSLRQPKTGSVSMAPARLLPKISWPEAASLAAGTTRNCRLPRTRFSKIFYVIVFNGNNRSGTAVASTDS